MKRFELRKIIKETIQEQSVQYAHPMDVDGLVTHFKSKIETDMGDHKNIWKRFKGAIEHLVTGDPNPNCGCDSYMPGGNF